MRTVAGRRQDALKADTTPEERRIHKAKIKRWVQANDEKYRPFGFAWGYRTNPKSWGCWAQLDTIEDDIVEYKTFRKGRRPSFETHRNARRDWRKAGIISREVDYYGEDGRGRHGSGYKIGVTRYFNFNRIIRNGVAEDFDFHAPLEATESDITPSETVVSQDAITPSDYPLALPPLITPSIQDYIPDEIQNLTPNSGQARREVAASISIRAEEDSPADPAYASWPRRKDRERDNAIWTRDRFPVVWWPGKDKTVVLTQEYMEGNGIPARKGARTLQLDYNQWQHVKGDLDDSQDQADWLAGDLLIPVDDCQECRARISMQRTFGGYHYTRPATPQPKPQPKLHPWEVPGWKPVPRAERDRQLGLAPGPEIVTHRPVKPRRSEEEIARAILEGRWDQVPA